MNPDDQIMLARAITLAADLHKRQVDKQGKPYIFHPLRVMLAVGCDDVVVAAAAVLHDAAEDHAKDITPAMRESLPQEVWDLVAVMTHDKAEPYMDYIRRVAMIPRAKRIKLADIGDNLGRLSGLPIDAQARAAAKYAEARAYLEATSCS